MGNVAVYLAWFHQIYFLQSLCTKGKVELECKTEQVEIWRCDSIKDSRSLWQQYRPQARQDKRAKASPGRRAHEGG